MEENQKYIFFAMSTWPNSPVRAKILSSFQYEGKNDAYFITTEFHSLKKDVNFWTKIANSGHSVWATLGQKTVSSPFAFRLHSKSLCVERLMTFQAPYSLDCYLYPISISITGFFWVTLSLMAGGLFSLEDFCSPGDYKKQHFST